jgi:hypothetical protein
VQCFLSVLTSTALPMFAHTGSESLEHPIKVNSFLDSITMYASQSTEKLEHSLLAIMMTTFSLLTEVLSVSSDKSEF